MTTKMQAIYKYEIPVPSIKANNIAQVMLPAQATILHFGTQVVTGPVITGPAWANLCAHRRKQAAGYSASGQSTAAGPLVEPTPPDRTEMIVESSIRKER